MLYIRTQNIHTVHMKYMLSNNLYVLFTNECAVYLKDQGDSLARKSSGRSKRRQSSSPTIEKKRKRSSASTSGSSRQKKASKDEELEE